MSDAWRDDFDSYEGGTRGAEGTKGTKGARGTTGSVTVRGSCPRRVGRVGPAGLVVLSTAAL